MRNRIQSLIIVPDIHGRNKNVRQVLRRKLTNHMIIFMGDYWDSFDLSYETQRDTFLEIISLKKRCPDNVILLLGNHDIHYLTKNVLYTGFQDHRALAIETLLRENLSSFQNAFQYGKYLFTHAGLSKPFWNVISEYYEKDNYNNVADYLNECSIEKAHTLVIKDGNHPMNNISMIRPYSLIMDMYLDEKIQCQVVGHTSGDSMRMYLGGKLIVCDCETLLEIDL